MCSRWAMKCSGIGLPSGPTMAGQTSTYTHSLFDSQYERISVFASCICAVRCHRAGVGLSPIATIRVFGSAVRMTV